jgi:tetratricopeptide (TPR) repeat protein
MARTWQGQQTSMLPPDFSATKADNQQGTTYQLRRQRDRFEYSTQLPDGNSLTAPIEDVMGGKRHGISFLSRLNKLGDFNLDRAALIEGRYAYSSSLHSLVVSPGFALEKPRTFEDAIGNVLSQNFEQKCLQCHGKPNTLGAGQEGGVRCESCHGPALNHLAGVGKGMPRQGVVNPARLSADEQLELCGQCHTGFTYQSDPLPDDLLVSNQVNALERTECFLQSGKQLTCTNCHDPHQDSPRLAEATTNTCLSCHSTSIKQHASICPVNHSANCIGCHMPSIQKGSFHMTDHWIRVHPEQGIKAQENSDPTLRSQITPKTEFLRLIVTADRAAAERAQQELQRGIPFARVAHDFSADPTAPGGGFLGAMELSAMDEKLKTAAASLRDGQTSNIVNLGDRYVILNRLSRDFKWEADQAFQQATDLKAHGSLKDAIAKDQQALDIYPYFLRAMIFMATALGEAGDAQHAAEILRFAAQSFPKDSVVQFNLGLVLTNQPADQIAAFERALELDPDMIPCYESLGAALYAAGRKQDAIDTFRKGLLIDPLSAKLNYNLGLALTNEGDAKEGERRIALAKRADSSLNRH